jgi:hypothetical protein
MTLDEAAEELRRAIDNQVVKDLTMSKNVTRMFEREALLDILADDNEFFEVLEDEVVDTSRWSEHHELIFKELATGKCYSADYSCGKTEYQDESPWEHDGDMIEVVEVEPVEVKTIKFRPVQIA